MPELNPTRRRFLQSSLLGGLAALAGPRLATAAPAPAPAVPHGPGPLAARSRIALTTGDDRTDNVFRGLKEFREEVPGRSARAGGDQAEQRGHRHPAVRDPRRLPGGDPRIPEVDWQAGQTVIAESAANGPTFEGFANYGYDKLAAKYGVKLVDLDQEPYDRVHVFDETDFRPHAVRMSRLLLDPQTFIISAAP